MKIIHPTHNYIVQYKLIYIMELCVSFNEKQCKENNNAKQLQSSKTEFLQNDDIQLDNNTISAFNKISNKYNLKNYTFYNSIDAFLRCAIVKNFIALLDIPKNYITPELYTFTVENASSTNIYEIILIIPKKYLTVDLYKIAIQKNFTIFSHIPENLLTTELCKFFITKCPNALDYLPKNF